jgi:hypothetical protein
MHVTWQCLVQILCIRPISSRGLLNSHKLKSSKTLIVMPFFLCLDFKKFERRSKHVLWWSTHTSQMGSLIFCLRQWFPFQFFADRLADLTATEHNRCTAHVNSSFTSYFAECTLYRKNISNKFSDTDDIYIYIYIYIATGTDFLYS